MALAYLPRLADALLDEFLAEVPAVLVVGPRASGKTTTALRRAKSVLRLGERAQAQAVAADPDAVLAGFDASPLLIDEHVIKNGAIPANGVKSVGFVRFREGLAPEVARPYWRDVHGPIAADISVLRRYEQNQVRAGAYRRATRPAWDGMALTWFDSIDDMRLSATEPAYAATLADGPEFLASGPTPTILCRELVVL